MCQFNDVMTCKYEMSLYIGKATRCKFKSMFFIVMKYNKKHGY